MSYTGGGEGRPNHEGQAILSAGQCAIYWKDYSGRSETRHGYSEGRGYFRTKVADGSDGDVSMQISHEGKTIWQEWQAGWLEQLCKIWKSSEVAGLLEKLFAVVLFVL